MKNKLLKYACLSVGALSLGLPLALSGTPAIMARAAGTSVNVSAADVIPDSVGNTSMDCLSHVYFTLPANGLVAAGDDPQMRFKASTEEGVITHITADGKETKHALNLAFTNQDANRYYIEFDNWSGDSFTVPVGDSIRLFGLAKRDNGDTINFAEPVVLKHSLEKVWSIKEEEVVYKKGELYPRGDGGNYNCLIKLTKSFVATYPKYNTWGNDGVLGGGFATFYPKGGESQQYKIGFVANDRNTLSFMSNGDPGAVWKDVKMPVTFKVGDYATIKNQTFTNYVNGVLYKLVIEDFTCEWDGENWIQHIVYNDHNYSYYGSDLSNISTYIWEDGSDKIFFLDFCIPDQNSVRIDTGWDKFYRAVNAMTIYPHDGGEPILTDALIIKKDTYGYRFLFPKVSWLQEQYKKCFYDFQEGDKFVLDGTFNIVSGDDRNNITFHEITFEFNGKAFDAYRTDLIQYIIEESSRLNDVASYDDAYEQKINELVNKIKSLTSKEYQEIDYDCIYKVTKQYRDILAHKAEASGKTVKRSTITADSLDFASQSSPHPTGASFRHNAIDFYYCETFERDSNGQIISGYSSADWTSNHRGIKDSYFLTPDGQKTIIDSALVLYHPLKSDGTMDETVFVGCFIFVNWTKPSSTEYASLYYGDRYVVNPTGYTFEKDNIFYLVELEGANVTWTGNGETSSGNWIDTNKIPNFSNFAGKVLAIGEVTYTQECKDRINAAKNAYEQLTSTEQARVPVALMSILETAEKEYNNLELQAQADEVVQLINSIGTVELTEQCNEKIIAARQAYDALSSAAKEKINAEQLKILTDAEALYADLQAQADADAVIALINNIGTVSYTADSRELIDAARNAYDSLSQAAQNKVDFEIYALLLAAESKYASLEAVVLFKNAVNSLNSNSKANEIFSTALECRRLYSLIENKTEVATELETLKTYIQKYNAEVAEFNEKASNDNQVALKLIGFNVVLTAAYGLALAILKKGAF